MAKILVVDDDVSLCYVIESWLKFQQHIVECVHTGKHACELIDEYEYDVIVLDWGLPDMSGTNLLKTYRSKGGRTPVLMLTGKDHIDEKEEGLDSGADDYVTKPFDVKELSARIRALLRRPLTFSGNVLTLGDLSMDLIKHQVVKGDQVLQLYPKEFALLEFLLRNQDRVCTTETLIDHVWKSEAGVGTETLRTCVNRLRKKIDTDRKLSYIENIPCIGYKIRVPVPGADK